MKESYNSYKTLFSSRNEVEAHRRTRSLQSPRCNEGSYATGLNHQQTLNLEFLRNLAQLRFHQLISLIVTLTADAVAVAAALSCSYLFPKWIPLTYNPFHFNHR